MDDVIYEMQNARKARYLFVVQMYNNKILSDISAGDCLKGNLDPDDDSTFWDDSNLPLTNETLGLYLIELSTNKNNKCIWQQDADPEVFPNLWRAGCGNSFYLDAEKPSDNHMKYCCYCGKEIAEGE